MPRSDNINYGLRANKGTAVLLWLLLPDGSRHVVDLGLLVHWLLVVGRLSARRDTKERMDIKRRESSQKILVA